MPAPNDFTILYLKIYVNYKCLKIYFDISNVQVNMLDHHEHEQFYGGLYLRWAHQRLYHKTDLDQFYHPAISSPRS